MSEHDRDNVVALRGGGPALNDVPGMLRKLADDIEAGDYGTVDALYAIMPREDDYPVVFGWGDVTGQNAPIVQCELAKAWFVQNLVRRD